VVGEVIESGRGIDVVVSEGGALVSFGGLTFGCVVVAGTVFLGSLAGEVVAFVDGGLVSVFGLLVLSYLSALESAVGCY